MMTSVRCILKIHPCFLDVEHDLEKDAVEDGDALEIILEEDEDAFEEDDDEQTIDVTLKLKVYGSFATVMANVCF